MSSMKRNEKCPCGSGKKYKHCCLQKDLAKSREASSAVEVEAEAYEELPAPKVATWKIFLASTGILGLIGLILGFVFGFKHAGAAVFGVGMIILVFYCAFRNIPTVRKRPGDAGNIDFGNRG